MAVSANASKKDIPVSVKPSRSANAKKDIPASTRKATNANVNTNITITITSMDTIMDMDVVEAADVATSTLPGSSLSESRILQTAHTSG